MYIHIYFLFICLLISFTSCEYISFEKNKEILFDDLIKNTRNHLSGYKLPKMIKFVDEVKRAPNGKADYKCALKIAKS